MTGGRVIALWAVPRSVSTAFEKSVSRRPDTSIVHEPFTDCYYFSRTARSTRYGVQPAKLDYDAAAALREIAAAPSPVVFVKDLAFQAEPYLPDRFLAGVTNTFIVRRPLAVLRSLRPLKPGFTEDEFGFEPLLRLWHRISDLTGQVPVMMDGDRLRGSPESQLRAYCERVGLPFHRGMLCWPDGRIRDWAEHERQSQAKWHATLEGSHAILPPSGQPEPEPDAREREIIERAENVYRTFTPYIM